MDKRLSASERFAAHKKRMKGRRGKDRNKWDRFLCARKPPGSIKWVDANKPEKYIFYLMDRHVRRRASHKVMNQWDLWLASFYGRYSMPEVTEKKLRILVLLDLLGMQGISGVEELKSIINDVDYVKYKHIKKNHRDKIENIKASFFKAVFEELERANFTTCEVLISQMPTAIKIITARMRGVDWYDEEKREYKSVSGDMFNASKAVLMLVDKMVIERRKSSLSTPLNELHSEMKNLVSGDSKDLEVILEERRQLSKNCEKNMNKGLSRNPKKRKKVAE